jgi:hypothetical protein
VDRALFHRENVIDSRLAGPGCEVEPSADRAAIDGNVTESEGPVLADIGFWVIGERVFVFVEETNTLYHDSTKILDVTA